MFNKFIILIFFTVIMLNADCSNQIGNASLNEIYIDKKSSFVEVATLKNIPITDWELLICYDGCDVYDLSNHNKTENDYHRFITIKDFTSKKNQKLSDTSIILLDSNKNPIDYFGKNKNNELIQEYLVGCDDLKNISTSPQFWHYYREPDLTGELVHGKPGNSSKNDLTPEDQNSDKNPDKPYPEYTCSVIKTPDQIYSGEYFDTEIKIGTSNRSDCDNESIEAISSISSTCYKDGEIDFIQKDKNTYSFNISESGTFDLALDIGQNDCKGSCSIQIKNVLPYKLILKKFVMENKTNDNWLYMDSTKEHNQTHDLTIHAVNKQDERNFNYTDECYSSDYNLTIKSDTNNPSHNPEINVSDAVYILDKNLSIIRLEASKKSWDNGVSNHQMNLNLNKPETPINPIKYRPYEITLDSDDSFHATTKGIDVNSTTFFYSRFEIDDVTTSKNIERTTGRVLIYSDDGVGVSSKQKYLNWYQFEQDDYSWLKSVETEKEKLHNKLTLKEGKVDVVLNKDQLKTSEIVYVDIPEWLWYSENNNPYSFELNCLTSPCFHYRFINSDNNGVKSGEFEGSSIDLNNSSGQPKGIKIFR